MSAKPPSATESPPSRASPPKPPHAPPPSQSPPATTHGDGVCKRPGLVAPRRHERGAAIQLGVGEPARALMIAHHLGGIRPGGCVRPRTMAMRLAPAWLTTELCAMLGTWLATREHGPVGIPHTLQLLIEASWLLLLTRQLWLAEPQARTRPTPRMRHEDH